MTFFENVYENTYLCGHYMSWYGNSVTWKNWLHSGGALNYIITVLNVYGLKF